MVALAHNVWADFKPQSWSAAFFHIRVFVCVQGPQWCQHGLQYNQASVCILGNLDLSRCSITFWWVKAGDSMVSIQPREIRRQTITADELSLNMTNTYTATNNQNTVLTTQSLLIIEVISMQLFFCFLKGTCTLYQGALQHRKHWFDWAALLCQRIWNHTNKAIQIPRKKINNKKMDWPRRWCF